MSCPCQLKETSLPVLGHISPVLQNWQTKPAWPTKVVVRMGSFSVPLKKLLKRFVNKSWFLFCFQLEWISLPLSPVFCRQEKVRGLNLNFLSPLSSLYQLPQMTNQKEEKVACSCHSEKESGGGKRESQVLLGWNYQELLLGLLEIFGEFFKVFLMTNTEEFLWLSSAPLSSS